MVGKSQVSTAIVGCGAFVKAVHLPNMLKEGRYRIHAAVDLDENAAKGVAKEYGAAYATTDFDKALSDPEVDLVVLTTRHNKHAGMAIRAAEARKNILCEKPMGLTLQECSEVLRAVRKNGVQYCIGYNRALAPLVCKGKALIAQQKRPAVIYHRIQSYFQANEFHWILDEKEGGGRIISEGCHIFDMFCALTGAEPVRVSAEGGIFTKSGKVTTPDTALITVAFDNGSVATMCIPSVGNSQAPKEWTEIYCGNMAVTIENFQKMISCVGATKEETTLPEVDKGHAVELKLLADALLTGTPVPNGAVSAMRSAVLCLKAIEAIQTHRVISVSPAEYGS